MKRQKNWKILAFAALLCLSLAGCGRETAVPADDVLDIYATFYPVYAFVQPLTTGIDDISLHCLVQPQDGCLRSYQMSDWDLALLNGADAVFAGGRGLEGFENLLYALGEGGPSVFTVLDDADLTVQQAINSNADVISHWMGENPHIYMDPEEARTILRRIEACLVSLLPEYASVFAENLQSAEAKLDHLLAELKDACNALQDEQVIVMNEALIYADAAYGLDIAMCYERESGQDITGVDLENCLETLRKCEAQVILIERQAPQSLISALEEAGYSVAQLDVLSTKRAQDGFEGYLQVQRANAKAILDAFSDAE